LSIIFAASIEETKATAFLAEATFFNHLLYYNLLKAKMDHQVFNFKVNIARAESPSNHAMFSYNFE
jgi:hypothetical protein